MAKYDVDLSNPEAFKAVVLNALNDLEDKFQNVDKKVEEISGFVSTLKTKLAIGSIVAGVIGSIIVAVISQGLNKWLGIG